MLHTGRIVPPTAARSGTLKVISSSAFWRLLSISQSWMLKILPSWSCDLHRNAHKARPSRGTAMIKYAPCSPILFKRVSSPVETAASNSWTETFGRFDRLWGFWCYLAILLAVETCFNGRSWSRGDQKPPSHNRLEGLSCTSITRGFIALPARHSQ